MAKERIDILVPEEELTRNEEKRTLLERTRRLLPTERAPVLVDPNQWALLAARGVSFAEYIRSPWDNLRHQILNIKWRLEHVRDDFPIPDRLVLEPDLGTLRGMEFPLEVTWLSDGPPKSHPLLHEVEDVDQLALPEPTDGVNGKRIAWYQAMRDLADEFDVRVNGQPLPLEVTITQPGGPIPSAFAVAGAHLFLWMRLDPERTHRLMDLVTRSHLRCIAYLAELTGRPPDHPLGQVGADTAELMRAADFREFVVPYYLRLWEAHPGERIFHMCGKIDHLLPALRDDLGIHYLDGFGFPVDRERLAEELGGRVAMRGGMHPVLVLEGPREAIVEEGVAYIRTVGRRGGFILSTGGGVAPGTPVEHMNALVEASLRAQAG
ncbi:MAG: hypothetical protein H5T59_13285 [Anaerolineae bacterium]|nr:hypothetical protein [Anaerolineae bacterium]